MSLKAFHIFFIIVSTLLAFGFAAWLIDGFVTGGDVWQLAGALLSLFMGVALIVYGIRFLRRLKHVSYI